jgi:hypothetical protein
VVQIGQSELFIGLSGFLGSIKRSVEREERYVCGLGEEKGLHFLPIASILHDKHNIISSVHIYKCTVKSIYILCVYHACMHACVLLF